MALSLLAKLRNKYFQEFIRMWGREPQSAKEWMSIQDNAVRELNKTKGAPLKPKAPPFQGWTPKVIPGGKGIESLIKSGDVTVGTAPKTTKKTLADKKDRDLLFRDADEDIARIKRENKQAVEDFKEKNTPKVYSKGDEGYDEITEKLGITARPGFPIKESGKADLKVVKTQKKDRPSIRLIKNFDQELDDITLAKEGYNLQEIGIIKRARNVMKKEGQNPDDALAWVRGEMADDAGIDFEDFMTDFDWGDFPGKAEGGRIGFNPGGPVDQQALIQMYLEEGLSYDDAVAAAQATSGLDMDLSKKADGGIARAGFPFGGPALKAIRAAWRANKDWGVGGPPYKPEATSFDIKKLTEKTLGEKLSLKDLKELSQSPVRPLNQPKFEEFNKELKNIKASILKEKMMERKLEAEAMLTAAEKTMKEANKESFMGVLKDTEFDMAKRITSQMTRESKQALKEVREGLKEIDIYMGMTQKQGRSLHQSGGLAYMLGEPTYMKYDGGGSVGHAPWLKPSGQQQPQGQDQSPTPQVGGAQSPGRGQPNPMKAPRGLPSLAPRTMDPQYMQQQMMQKMMMGQGQQPRMGRAEGGMTQEDFNRFLKEREEGHREGGKYQLKEDWERYKRFKQYGPGSVQEAADGGRIGLMYGGDPGFQFEYGGSWADWRDQHQHQMPVTDYIKTRLPKERLPFRDSAAGGGIIKLLKNLLKKKPKKDVIKPFEFPDAGIGSDFQKKLLDDMLKSKSRLKDFDPKGKPHASGGIARLPFAAGGFNKARRAFLKMLATLGIGTAVAKSGVSLFSKTAPKTIKAVETITRGADGMPTYITDLIEVVKAKGTRDIIEGFKRSDYSTVHSYKGVDVTEDALGNIKIKKPTEGVATDASTGKMHEGISQEIQMEIIPGEYIQKGSTVSDEAAKAVKTSDEYFEGTVRPDMDGKMKDFEEGIDELDHLELKKIADEKHITKSGKKYYDWTGHEFSDLPKKTKKASGGRVPLGGGGIIKVLKKALKKFKNVHDVSNAKIENYIMDQGYKLGKYYKKNPGKGLSHSTAVGTGVLISRHLDRQKRGKKASGGLAHMLGE